MKHYIVVKITSKGIDALKTLFWEEKLALEEAKNVYKYIYYPDIVAVLSYDDGIIIQEKMFGVYSCRNKVLEKLIENEKKVFEKYILPNLTEQEKYTPKYFIQASYDNSEWSAWTETTDVEEAKRITRVVEYYGYYAKVIKRNEFHKRSIVYNSKTKKKAPYYRCNNYIGVLDHIDASYNDALNAAAKVAVSVENEIFQETKDDFFALWKFKLEEI